MQKQRIAFDLRVFGSISELGKEHGDLMLSAVAARKNAYAPYSNFQVGAAVLLENGAVVIGNNQENACFPSGLCAERVAIFQAGAAYPGVVIKAVAISATSTARSLKIPAAPCGNCRQSIAEYELKQAQPIAILMMGAEGDIFQCDAIGDLLPLAFGSTYLKGE